MILKIASYITAISVILVGLIKVYKVVKNIDDKVDSFEKSQKEDRLSILKLIIINKNMPLDERVTAGEEYIKSGGNGSVHAMVEVLTEKYKNELRK